MGLVVGCLARSIHAEIQPNIIVILSDDMGYSDVGCYGGEIETPTLDRLAHNGIRFTQFIIQVVAAQLEQACYQVCILIRPASVI